MKISTKGRYALRILIDIAINQQTKYDVWINVSVRQIAERQDISEKYLEGIMSRLAQGGLVRSERGKYGGYQLAKNPSEITIYDVLIATEDSLAIVTCLEEDEESVCSRNSECSTFRFWTDLQAYIHRYLKAVTLEDVLENRGTPVLSLIFRKKVEQKNMNSIEERCKYGDL